VIFSWAIAGAAAKKSPSAASVSASADIPLGFTLFSLICRVFNRLDKD
jgi:hypothetical protein